MELIDLQSILPLVDPFVATRNNLQSDPVLRNASSLPGNIVVKQILVTIIDIVVLEQLDPKWF